MIDMECFDCDAFLGERSTPLETSWTWDSSDIGFEDRGFFEASLGDSDESRLRFKVDSGIRVLGTAMVFRAVMFEAKNCCVMRLWTSRLRTMRL